MAMDNLQKSERVIAKVLEALLEQGIQYQTYLEFQELHLPEEMEPFFQGCCLWLLDEGIVRCTNIQQVLQGMPMVNPVITAYGFKILGQRFLDGSDDEAAATSTDVAHVVREVASGERSYSGLGDFLGGLLGGFTKSMGSG